MSHFYEPEDYQQDDEPEFLPPPEGDESFPIHPEVTVPLDGEDGNAFSILGRTRKAMRHAGLTEEEMARFTTEATSGDYDHLLQTVIKWVATE